MQIKLDTQKIFLVADEIRFMDIRRISSMQKVKIITKKAIIDFFAG